MIKNRNPIYDIMKGICILSVILVHIPKEINLINIPITFHIVGFFFVHGLILNKQNIVKNSEKIRLSIKKMIKVYFKLSLCVIIFNSLIVIATNSSIDILKKEIIDIVLLSGTGTLWFIPCYFLGELLFYIETKYCNKGNIKYYHYIPSLLLFLFILIYIKNNCSNQYILLMIALIGKAIVSNIFFVFGYYFAYIEDIYKEKISSIFGFLLSIIILVFLKVIPISVGDLHNFEISYYYIIGSILGIIFLYNTSLFISRIKTISTFLNG